MTRGRFLRRELTKFSAHEAWNFRRFQYQLESDIARIILVGFEQYFCEILRYLRQYRTRECLLY